MKNNFFDALGEVYNIERYLYKNKNFTMEQLQENRVWYEISEVGINILDVFDTKEFYVYYLERVNNKKHPYKTIAKVPVFRKPKVWNCKVNTTKEFIEMFGGLRKISNLQKYMKYFAEITSCWKQKQQYVILTDIINSSKSTNEINYLIELGLISIRTDYYNPDKHISKTYWYNPKIIEISKKIQKELKCIISVPNQIEKLSNKTYQKFNELFTVVNNYLISSSESPHYKFNIRESKKYDNVLTGRPTNPWFRLHSIENHPEMPLNKTRQGVFLEYFGYQVNHKSLSKNYWYYDVVASIPRILYFLNHKGKWLNENIDIYCLIANELKIRFDEYIRELIKQKTLISNFWVKVGKPDKFMIAVRNVIGKNKWKSEIFILEAYLYLLVYTKLILEQKYKLNWVFDSFEFYGEIHPTQDYMRELVSKTSKEFYKIITEKNYKLIDSLIEDVKMLKNYKEIDYTDFSLENIERINILESSCYHKIREIDNEQFKENYNEFLEKHSDIQFHDKYSLKEDKYSLKEDKYSKKGDKYSLKEDKYSKGEDPYSIKFEAIIDNLTKLLRKSKTVHWSKLNISKTTYYSLLKREEFLSKFIADKGNIHYK